jgi:hypothetical protein
MSLRLVWVPLFECFFGFGFCGVFLCGFLCFNGFPFAVLKCDDEGSKMYNPEMVLSNLWSFAERTYENWQRYEDAAFVGMINLAYTGAWHYNKT